LYQFVVDDMWTTDHEVPQEEDGYYNVNNISLPEQIKRKTTTMPETTSNSATGTSETSPGSNRHSVTAVTGLAAGGSAGAAMLSSVSPQSTTAGLADEVPKEGKKDVGAATISSAAPQSTIPGPLPQELPGSDVSPPLPSQPVPQKDITDLITKLERQSVKALALKDASAYNSFLAPDSTRVSSEGLAYTHKPSGKEWQRWIKPEMSEIHVLRVMEGVAIIYYPVVPTGRTTQAWV
jgi:hypothetical protein